VRSEVSDLAQLRQVENGNLEVRLQQSLLFNVMAHQSGQRPIHVWLKFVVVLNNVLNELRVFMLIVAEMAEVDDHGLLLVLGHLLGVLSIVLQRLVFVAVWEVVPQGFIVFVIWLQHESEKRKKDEMEQETQLEN